MVDPAIHADNVTTMKRYTFRIVTRGPEGEYRICDYVSEEEVRRRHAQVGVADYSLDMSIRGYPVLKGLVGPILESGSVLRYESPEVFEQLSKELYDNKRRKRNSRGNRRQKLEAENFNPEC